MGPNPTPGDLSPVARGLSGASFGDRNLEERTWAGRASILERVREERRARGVLGPSLGSMRPSHLPATLPGRGVPSE